MREITRGWGGTIREINIIVQNYDGRLCPAAHGRHKLFPQTLFEGLGGTMCLICVLVMQPRVS